jgi:hypothetical protein
LERGGGNWLIDGNRFPPDAIAGRISIDDDTASAVMRLVKESREPIELKKNMRVGRGDEAVVGEAAPRCRLAADQTSVSGTQRADEGGGVMDDDACADRAQPGLAGDCNTELPTHIQPLIDCLPDDLTAAERAKTVRLIYDVIVNVLTFDETCEKLRIVFNRMDPAGIKFEACKIKSWQKSMVFSSYEISKNGIQLDPAKVTAIVEWPTPRGITETREFLDFGAYYVKHIRDYAGLAQPLYDLTRIRCDRSDFDSMCDTCRRRLFVCVVKRRRKTGVSARHDDDFMVSVAEPEVPSTGETIAGEGCDAGARLSATRTPRRSDLRRETMETDRIIIADDLLRAEQ